VIVYDLAHQWLSGRGNVSYVAGDLRDMMLRDSVVDVIVCISTLEHIGLDNTMLYTDDRRFQETRSDDYTRALREFRRVLRPGGRLYVTVPFGRPTRLRWLQQFDAAGVNALVDAFGGAEEQTAYFRYTSAGWQTATAAECADCEYFDVHSRGSFDPDMAAAARAVACFEFVRD
jgi:ubiquinone/menaquinone biosynthesis C-methylase UbiE